MDFSFTTEQQMMISAARRMVETDIQPVLDANDRKKGLPKAAILKIMAKAANLGMTCARIPEEGGGAGMTMLDYGLITEQNSTERRPYPATARGHYHAHLFRLYARAKGALSRRSDDG